MEERKIQCPRCGHDAFYVYRKENGAFAGCWHCAETLNIKVGCYDMLKHPEDYKPPETRCPVCGAPCRHIYRKARYFEIVGCEHCMLELNADEDVSVHPGDYGLPNGEEKDDE